MLKSEYFNKINKFINPDEYLETFETNLNKDEAAKEFWNTIFPKLINNFGNQIQISTTENVENVVNLYKKEYHDQINELMNKKEDTFLSVRMLLELNEIFLKKYGFGDVWKAQKQHDNKQALSLFSVRLSEIDSIKDTKKRWQELVRGVLAGNVFDSGAIAVKEILKDNENFGLKEALQKIPERPWLIDSFEDFVSRIENESNPYFCCTIFCDNSGVDCILGIIPFCRELLRRNIKVILSANSEPALNDVTFPELVEVIEAAAEHCAIINDNYRNKNLMLSASGQKGCCLNFLSLNENLLELMIENKVDLIVIEGMGRGLHTNLNSRFFCDSLKLAVIKNKFLASRLGGTLFDAICKFEGKKQ